MEAFRPADFGGDHEVTVWNPGVAVVFHSPWDGVFPLLGLSFFLLGPAAYLLGRNAPSGHESDMMGLAVLAEVIGAMIGIPSLVGLFKAKSRTVRLDWAERTISIRDGSRTQVIPMADVAAVSSTATIRWRAAAAAVWAPIPAAWPPTSYNCEVRLHWRDASAAPAAATLVETGVSDEADGPYRRALPLATELARSLGVERRVTDYDVRRPEGALTPRLAADYPRHTWSTSSRKDGGMTVRFSNAVLLLTLASPAAWAQVNMGEQKPEATLPFEMTTVSSTFELPWRIAFLPDGRMLVTEKIGPIWLVSAEGQKIAPLGGTPAVYWQGQNGMLGVYVSPATPPTRASTSPTSSRATMAAARRWPAPSSMSNVCLGWRTSR